MKQFLPALLGLAFSLNALYAQQDNCDLTIALVQAVDESCLGAQDGFIQIAIQNGTPPYSILWSNGDTTATINNLGAGNYTVTVTDSEGCTQSDIHYFNGISGIDEMPIPDGDTALYLSIPFILDTFPAGAIVSDTMPFDNFCVIMEHSWMRDLEISLTCPNGSTVIMHQFAGQMGNEVFLGVPYEADEGLPEPIPGIGYTYCWKENAANGTWIEYANLNNPGTLPPGDYAPYESFTNFYGCPFNGEWTLFIQDLWSIDNGYLFGAGVASLSDSIVQEITLGTNFPPCIMPCPPLPLYQLLCRPWVDSLISFYSETTDCEQEPFYLIQYAWGDNNAFYGFSHYGTDSGGEDFFNCEGNYIGSCFNTIAGLMCDSIVDSLQLIDTLWQCGDPRPFAEIAFEADIDSCGTDMHQLTALVSGPGIGSLELHWNTGSADATIPVSLDSTYSLTVTNFFGCESTDTFTVEADLAPPLEGSLITTPATDSTAGCIIALLISDGYLPYTYAWEGINSNGQAEPGPFSITVTDAAGCTLSFSDTCTILVTGTQQPEQLPLQFLLYPNPVREELYIQLAFPEARKGSLLLSDLSGQILWQQEFNTQAVSTRLPLSHLPSPGRRQAQEHLEHLPKEHLEHLPKGLLEHLPKGIYLISWRDSKGTIVSKAFVKE